MNKPVGTKKDGLQSDQTLQPEKQKEILIPDQGTNKNIIPADAVKGKWYTEYQNQKKQKRVFIEDNEKTRKANKNIRYQIYPRFFQFPFEDGKPEPVRKDDFLVDLDCADEQDRTVKEARLIIKEVEEKYHVPPELWEIWLSGGKGVHLKLPAVCFGLEQGAQKLPLYYKRFAGDLVMLLNLETVDTSIYNMRTGKPFRRENIQRENGKYKVRVTLKELMSKSFEDLEPLCEKPRDITAVVGTGKASELLISKMKAVVSAVDKNEQITRKDKPQKEIIARLDGKTAACIECLINDDSEPNPGHRDFNRISQTLTRYCHMKELDLEGSVELCKPFIEGYSGSSSLGTVEDRMGNFKARWHSMKGEKFSCFYVQSLRLPEVHEHCRRCAVEHLSEATIKERLENLQAKWAKSSDDGNLPPDATEEWCRIVYEANPPNDVALRAALQMVAKLLPATIGIKAVKDTYAEYVLRMGEIKTRELEENVRVAQEKGELPFNVMYRATNLDDAIRVAELALNERPGALECFRFGEIVSFIEEKAPMGARAIKKGDKVPKIPLIKPYRHLVLRCRLESSIQFMVKDKKSGIPFDIAPPPDVINGIIDRSAIQTYLPQVDGLATTPILRGDGSYAYRKGPDKKSRLYLSQTWDKSKLIKGEDVDRKRAAELFKGIADGPFGEFEFKEKLDLVSAVSFLMTGTIRKILPIAPGCAATAHIQGSGKTTLFLIIHALIAGRDMPVYTLPEDSGEEGKKEIISTLIENPPVVCYDNVDDGKTIRNALLSRIITQAEYTGRYLGVSKNVTVPTNTLICVTGNNITFTSDLVRRFLQCRLEAVGKNPERRNFEHKHVLPWILSIREDVIVSVLGIIAGFLASCRIGGERIGGGIGGDNGFGVDMPASGFAAWDELVRFPLLWATGVDLLDSFDTVAADSSDNLAKHVLVSELVREFGRGTFTAKDIVEHIDKKTTAHNRLGCDMSQAIDGVSSGAINFSSPRSMSNIIQKVIGFHSDDGVLRKEHVRNVNVYHVEGEMTWEDLL